MDVLFVDGAHDLDLNKAAFEGLLPALAQFALVAVHDTGTVSRGWTPDWLQREIPPRRWIGDSYEHQPDERAFVNWLREAHPEFAQIHLHTDRWPRDGLTLLQRSVPLPRPSA